MAIEIKQLQIKSNVVQRCASGGEEGAEAERNASLKEELLAECRKLVAEVLADLRER